MASIRPREALGATQAHGHTVLMLAVNSCGMEVWQYADFPCISPRSTMNRANLRAVMRKTKGGNSKTQSIYKVPNVPEGGKEGQALANHREKGRH